MPKLTKRFVEAVKPGPKGTAVWDDEVTGFGLHTHVLEMVRQLDFPSDGHAVLGDARRPPGSVEDAAI
jgi:hypothetical protein